MRISYRWFVRMLGTELPIAELVQRLTNLGLEVEGVIDCGIESGKIVTGQILEMGPHPNAENLVLCQVDVARESPLRIVCGAKNMKPGDRVPVAVEGAKLPNGLTIKRSKIRGEESQGMMCSGRELGWSEDHQGLLILPPEEEYFPLGKPFDSLIEIKVTPNRPDCLSVYGIARDLAAAMSRTMLPYPDFQIEELGAVVESLAKVRNEAPTQCPSYVGRVITDVKIGPSPMWLQRAVESAGIRSINNVVDVTNYVLMELGHPMHAFDLDLVAQREIIVRMAREGEKVETLDGQVATLTAADLLIADSEKPTALAGIMGCGNTEISDATTNVFLECAYFDPATIRLTSKRLAKSTDSSYRFERGVDWQHLVEASARAARLIQQVAGGKIAKGYISAGPGGKEVQPISASAERVSKLLGVEIAQEEFVGILEALGFRIERAGNELSVHVPAYRPDVSREADLVEEVARVIGYDRIPPELPHIQSGAREEAGENRAISIVRDVFTSAGLNEAVNYGFQAESMFAEWGIPREKMVLLQNALSNEYNAMRPHLLPGVVASVLYNQNHGQTDVRLFEVGKVFRPGTSETVEEVEFAAVIQGSAEDIGWRKPARQADFYDAKAIAEQLAATLGVVMLEAAPVSEGFAKGVLHPGKSAEFRSGGVTLCYGGELHPALKRKLELRKDTIVLFGSCKALEPLLNQRPQTREIPQFPAVARDIAIVVDQAVSSAEIESTITKRAKNLLAEIKLFDVYEGDRIPEGKKSLAYQLRFRALDKTLTDDEINKLQQQILGDLKAKLGAELRS